jgi:adenosylhomocysteine nucleosidase
MRRIAILAAMEQEVAGLRATMLVDESLTQRPSPRTAGREYLAGTLWDVPVVLAASRWGKVAAAVTTTHVLGTFDPSHVVFTGVAGSLSPAVAVGDLVVAGTLVQHDMDASPLFPRHEIPLLGVSGFVADGTLSHRLQGAARRFLAEEFDSQISPTTAAEFGISSPAVHVGQIASGDRFVSGGAQSTRLREHLPEALCVEMEGAAAAQVCHEHGVPFGAVRVISDSAADNAHVDFPAFLDRVASRYSFGVLRHVLQSLYG